jgi:hypothetical protein
VDIGGHPPIPLAQQIVFNPGNFLVVFQVPNLWGRFEALNNIFWGFVAQVIARGIDLVPVENCSYWLDLSNGLSCA